MEHNLQQWLLNLDGFREKYIPLLYSSLVSQFPSIIQSEEFKNKQIEYDYLLNCASVLSESSETQPIDTALRICQHTLVNEVPLQYKMAASFILNKMANEPAIRLAIKNGNLDRSFFGNFSLRNKLNWFRNEIEQKIYVLNGKDIIANNFQKSAWKTLKNINCTTLSAPTSVGKSFIILKFIEDKLITSNINAVYIVPTRALVHQIEEDITELLKDLDKNSYNIVTIPTIIDIEKNKSNIFVFTQERLHYFMSKNGSNIVVNLLIVDEAHKIGDGYRGILLQQAIERILGNNIPDNIVFATPTAERPELLMEDLPEGIKKSTVESDVVTVNQNLFWVKESGNDAKTWSVELWQNNDKLEMGSLTFSSEPNTLRKRLTFSAYSLGKDSYGNIIYANGAADAEEIAILLYNMIGEDSEDQELREASKLSQQAVHSKYRLSTVILRGIAFHYGNMPLILRVEIERLFKSGKIKFLICTSTLIEGVNLPCKNIFVRGPKKGRTTKMTLEDFWNLAGRAGRWGKEFQGNIFCIDPNSSDWINGQAPKTKRKFTIRKTVDNVINDVDNFIKYINEYRIKAPSIPYDEYEYMSSYAASLIINGTSLEQTHLIRRFESEVLSKIDTSILNIIKNMPLSTEIISKNPGVSPIGMVKLYEYFVNRERREEAITLIPPSPSSENAVEDLCQIFLRINKCFGPKFGFGYAGKAFYHALLTVNWMRGYPLPRIISERVKRKEKGSKKINLHGEIRDTMVEVENIARFLAPKYLTCYCDVLKEYLEHTDRKELGERIKELSLVLEFGVPLKTQISLMSLGLSRTTVLELSKTIPEDSFSKSEAYDYLISGTWKILELPVPMVLEIELVLAKAEGKVFNDEISWENIY